MGFPEGSEIYILEHGKRIDRARVMSNNISEITIESMELHPGIQSQFVHIVEYGGWKLLFYGLGGERCFSQRGRVYQLEAT